MGRIWTPAQTAPHPSSVSGLSFMGEQVLQALQKKWLDSYKCLSSVVTVPAHYLIDNREGVTFEEPSPTYRIPFVSEPVTDLCALRAANTASAKWRTTAVLQSLQLNRETSSVTNRDISVASDMEQLTDNNRILHQPGYQCNKLRETVTAPIPNSRLQMNNSDSTINCKDQENIVCPVFDRKYNENHSQKFMLPSKFNTGEDSYQKNSCIQNEVSYHLSEDHTNKDMGICRINLQKENDKQMNYILNVSETSGPKMNSFEDLLKTQNELSAHTHKTSAALILQHAVVQKPPEGCHTGKGPEINTNDEALVLSCDMFSISNESVLDDKLQNFANQAETTKAALNNIVTQSASKFMESDFNKFESELCEKCPSSRIQPLVTVTFKNKFLRECVCPQDGGHMKKVETENLEMAVPEDENHKIGNQDTEISANFLLHVADFQSSAITALQKIQFSHESHKTINLKTRGSSKELVTETLDQSQYKEEVLPPVGQQSTKACPMKEQDHRNRFLRGRHDMPMKRKLEVPEMFQKTGKTKGTLCYNQQTACSEVPISCSKTQASSPLSMKDVIADTCASDSRNKRKTTFQVPFKKILTEGKQDLEKCEAQIVKGEDFNIVTLTDDSFYDITSRLQEHGLLEISLTILYREGFSQLNKPCEISKFANCTPEGLIFAVTVQPGNTDFCYLNVSDKHWKNNNVPQAFLSLLLSARCRKICYDAQELIIFLTDKYGFETEQVCLKWILLDPKVGCWLLDPDHPPGQFADAVHALGVQMGKPNASWNMKTTACHQLQLLSSVTEKLYHKLTEQGLWKIFLDIEMKLVPVLAVMELRGICIDKERLKEMESILESQMDKLKDAAYRAAGKHFQLNSVPQLSQILYEDLKLDQKASIKVKATVSRGAKSTSTPVLKLLQPFHPLPAIVLEYRHLHKLNSTYVAGMLQHTKGSYIFTTWEQTAGATGRLTSSNPNLQSIPRQPILISSQTNEQRSILLRFPFIPRSGHVFLSVDFQHIEFRIFAHLAKDVALCQLLHKPGDIFLNLAQMWLYKKSAVITAEDREKTKRIVYAMMYGAGARKLAEILEVTGDEACYIINSFNNVCPALRTFHRQVIDECRKQGYLFTVGGRRRLFPTICSSNLATRARTERQAINFVIQGSAADLCKSAMLQTQYKLQERHLAHDAHLLLQIHDELLWEVNAAQLTNVKGIVKTVMEESKSFFGLSENISVPLPVVISTGENWADMTP